MDDDNEDSVGKMQLNIQYINLEYVANSNLFTALVRQTAAWCIKENYITMKDWLTNLHVDDIKHLVDKWERCVKLGEDGETFKVLASMLCVGEGGELPVTQQELWDVVNRLQMLVSAESLTRKGFAKFNRDLATLTAPVEPDAILTLQLPEQFLTALEKLNQTEAKQPPRDVDPQFPGRKPK